MLGRPKLIVGLGNPGRQYEGTRHNIGFEVLDRLAEKLDCSFRNKWRFSAQVGEVAGESGRLVLAKPQTYTNRSGRAVRALLNWLKISPAELLVVVDDADLPVGQIRLRASGGSGGHNGLRSIIESLGGNEEFARLRVGIGRSRPVGEDITGHVLSKFSAEERAVAREGVASAVEAIVMTAHDGIAAAMNKFNRRQTTIPVRREGDEH
jgi:PTH1 family peptidyl-tRNA hydrolase